MSTTSDDSLITRRGRRQLQTSASRGCIDIILSASGRFHIASKDARESKFVHPGLKKSASGTHGRPLINTETLPAPHFGICLSTLVYNLLVLTHVKTYFILFENTVN